MHGCTACFKVRTSCPSWFRELAFFKGFLGQSPQDGKVPLWKGGCGLPQASRDFISSPSSSLDKPFTTLEPSKLTHASGRPPFCFTLWGSALYIQALLKPFRKVQLTDHLLLGAFPGSSVLFLPVSRSTF